MPNTTRLADLAETLAAPSVATEQNLALGLKESTTLRTTVLPRVEIVDAKPRLVVEQRRRFEPLGRLGEGGHGEVVGARDQDIGRNVAIKRMRVERWSPGTALQFAEEVRTVGQLEHPNIVPIHDVGVDENGDYYFVMKYVEGETLETLIEKLAAGDPVAHARHGIERRVQIFVAVLEAVAYAHARGILHRDLKPANVMVGAFGEVSLMDWGVAKRKDQAPLLEQRAGEIVGTPAYMSPEQARGEPADERSDVYALSLLFHELLCLSHPLADKKTLPDMLRGVVEEPVPHTSFVASPHQPPAPAELGWFVQKGLAKSPADRFQSVAEMLARLERRAEGDFPIQCPSTFSKRVLAAFKRFVDHHPRLTMIALSILALLVVVAMVALAWAAIHR